MTSNSSTVDIGLQDIAVATSSICSIDGVKGTLSYRGYDIADLGNNVTFEEVVHLLWFGDLPNRQQLQELRERLSAERLLPEPMFDIMRALPPTAKPISVLRTTVSALGLFDDTAEQITPEMNLAHAIRLTARMGPIAASWARIAEGKDPVQAAPDLTIAENFLYIMRGGVRPSADEARALDVALILQAEHEFNASTFAARVVVATLSDMYSATAAAIGALKGPLHGGANEAVMHMVEQIGAPEGAAKWVHDALERHERVMGFGHRVYKNADPRAEVLRDFSKRLGQQTSNSGPYEVSLAVEAAVKSERNLNPNVDFYMASVLHTLGIPTELFTPVFATSRISGWTAHMLEQYEHNRLIRPRAEYIGSGPRQSVPIDQR